MTEYTFATPQPTRLYAELTAGKIVVTAGETTETRISVEGRDPERVLVEQHGEQISVIAPKQWGLVLFNSYAVTVSLPADSSLAIKTGSADITGTGRVRDVLAKSGSGEVSLDHATGTVDVTTGSGDVSTGRVEGPLKVKTGSGDIVVDAALAAAVLASGSGDIRVGESDGPVNAKTGSGDIRVRDAHDDISMSTGTGDFEVGTAHRGRISGKGASGDVSVGIPPGVPVWTDLTTVTGRIRSTLPATGAPAEGQDHVEVRLQTVTGDITLQPA
jgi:DUF4097 and DUF4098 domain-containing protein YvlB